MKRIAILGLLVTLGVSRAAVENTCAECHQKLEIPELRAPVEQWKHSIHYENGISCADCHGGDPTQTVASQAMNPAAGFVGAPDETEVPEFCGKCHVAVRDNYLKSAHARALFADEGGPNCVTCHTAHQQQRVTLDLINEELCGTCHDFDRARRLKNLFQSTEVALVTMENRIDALFSRGLDVESERKSLFATRNRAHRFTHVLDIQRIRPGLDSVQTDLKQIETRVAEKERIVRNRKRIGALLVALFLFGAIVAWAYFKTLKRDALHQ